MIKGHGDDGFAYGRAIVHDFSSNVIAAMRPKGLLEHLQQSVTIVGHYPQPAAEQLAAELACRMDIPENCVLPTNGATEGIYLVAAAYGGATSAIVEPTFSEYADACRIYRHSLRQVRGIEEAGDDAGMVWLCNPNNPTGRLKGKETLMDYAGRHRNRLIVIDCSYEHSAEGDFISAAEARRAGNIILIHSMTKRFAIPGLRLGFVTAADNIIRHIGEWKQPWSVNALAAEAGVWLCRNAGKTDISPFTEECRWLQSEINRIGGIEALPTDTTFFLARLDRPCSTELKERLAREGILVRDACNFHFLDKHYIRIAAQERRSNEELLKALKKCILR